MQNLFRRIIVPGILVWFAFCTAQGQTTNQLLIPKSNSPYSRFGLGDFQAPYFTRQMAMGGTGITALHPSYLNPINPASLGFLRNAALEAAVDLKYSNFQEGDDNSSFWTGNLNYLALGFPLQNPINLALDQRRPDFDWGMQFILQPYTLVGYNVEVNEPESGFGPYTNSLKGTGGTYKLSWANGWRYKNLALGINAAYVFGKTTNSRRLSLDLLSENAYSTELLDEYYVSGFQFRFGANYVIKLDEDRQEPSTTLSDQRRIILGAFLNNRTSVNVTNSSFYNRDNFSIRLNSVDTILVVENERLSGQLPTEMGFGITYEKANSFRISAEYQMGLWSEYENEAKPESLSDNYRASVGAEYIPNAASYNRYWERMRYRIGAYYGSDPRTINGVQLQQYGLTLGLGLPVVMPRQTTSYIHLALEVGRFGDGDLLQENYARINLGFTLNDNSWFFKRKFN